MTSTSRKPRPTNLKRGWNSNCKGGSSCLGIFILRRLIEKLSLLHVNVGIKPKESAIGASRHSMCNILSYQKISKNVKNMIPLHNLTTAADAVSQSPLCPGYCRVKPGQVDQVHHPPSDEIFRVTKVTHQLWQPRNSSKLRFRLGWFDGTRDGKKRERPYPHLAERPAGALRSFCRCERDSG